MCIFNTSGTLNSELPSYSEVDDFFALYEIHDQYMSYRCYFVLQNHHALAPLELLLLLYQHALHLR